MKFIWRHCRSAALVGLLSAGTLQADTIERADPCIHTYDRLTPLSSGKVLPAIRLPIVVVSFVEPPASCHRFRRGGMGEEIEDPLTAIQLAQRRERVERETYEYWIKLNLNPEQKARTEQILLDEYEPELDVLFRPALAWTSNTMFGSTHYAIAQFKMTANHHRVVRDKLIVFLTSAQIEKLDALHKQLSEYRYQARETARQLRTSGYKLEDLNDPALQKELEEESAIELHMWSVRLNLRSDQVVPFTDALRSAEDDGYAAAEKDGPLEVQFASYGRMMGIAFIHRTNLIEAKSLIDRSKPVLTPEQHAALVKYVASRSIILEAKEFFAKGPQGEPQ